MMNCTEMQTLIPTYADGEVDGLRRLAIQKHLRDCADCAARHNELTTLKTRIRAEAAYFAAPPGLQARILATVSSLHSDDSTRITHRKERWRWVFTGAFAGCALTVLVWLGGNALMNARNEEDLATEATTLHVRATLGNHHLDVASSDRHTVKPWLSARLDYSPPVRDFGAQEFPLLGARIDYLQRRPVATLVYRYHDHMIDVFVRPQSEAAAQRLMRTVRGFNVAPAVGSGMEWLAVSDLNKDALSKFVSQLARDENSSGH